MDKLKALVTRKWQELFLLKASLIGGGEMRAMTFPGIRFQMRKTTEILTVGRR
jgi:hypothetical protein